MIIPQLVSCSPRRGTFAPHRVSMAVFKHRCAADRAHVKKRLISHSNLERQPTGRTVGPCMTRAKLSPPDYCSPLQLELTERREWFHRDSARRDCFPGELGPVHPAVHDRRRRQGDLSTGEHERTSLQRSQSKSVGNLLGGRTNCESFSNNVLCTYLQAKQLYDGMLAKQNKENYQN